MRNKTLWVAAAHCLDGLLRCRHAQCPARRLAHDKIEEELVRQTEPGSDDQYEEIIRDQRSPHPKPGSQRKRLPVARSQGVMLQLGKLRTHHGRISHLDTATRNEPRRFASIRPPSPAGNYLLVNGGRNA